ncbi:peptide-methionine (S)-S-oxide reductase MsrA [Alcaligenaceae bacterium LF4-65]|jgi:peptide-methionine (S)-S-oxide reductase|uniref:Peptide methionine sulfoxide reductase MsrA n=1 Tax=Zwartia hollandica TaxID=324606 RepID=A0A953T2S6_9BURK|nr:peptide-methionine (S)-S-oxide reductase MsrA [Zwartia hollandica]MBZ1351798.1 peptide-methionine (S)-S-oxide reductase MsrA [Zwartia hollandica]
MSSTPVEMQSAVFGGGCFWCVEAVFAALHGVHSAQSGYCGGAVDNPSYEQVCTKQTGHIEVVKIDFDPTQISYKDLLEVLFAIHDPTTPGRQGNDVGPQYQSAIFWQDVAQREMAAAVISELNVSGEFAAPICTELRPAATFWPAEAYHDNYFALHPEQGYCQMVVAPKVQKFRKRFAARLKS